MILKNLFVFFFGVLLIGCALPVSEREAQQFIPYEELQVVSLVRQGLDYYTRSRFIDAELKFRQALYFAPEAENIQLNLAVALEQQDLSDEAISIFRKLVEKKPESIRYLSGLAHAYLSVGDFEQALATYLEALDLAIDKNDLGKIVDLSDSLSVLYFRIGREEEAFCYSSFSLVNRFDLRHVFLHSRLLGALGAFDEALDLLAAPTLEKGIASAPEILTQLALTYFSSEKFEQAYEYSIRALGDRGINANAEYEATLISTLADEIIEEQKTQWIVEGESLEPEVIEEEQENEEEGSVLDSDPLDNVLSIYWPINLLDMLWQLEEAGLTANKEDKN